MDTISKFFNGPDEDEKNGFVLIERKRLRGGTESYDIMDIEGGLKGEVKDQISGKTPDAALSGLDCATSLKHDLATLVLQASHYQ